MTTKRRPVPQPVRSEPISGPLDVGRLKDFIIGIQQDVADSNANFRRTNEHILAGAAAWHVYRQFRRR